jgi:hypothetical protein
MNASTTSVFVENATTTEALLRQIAVQQNDIQLGLGLIIGLLVFAMTARAFVIKSRLWNC